MTILDTFGLRLLDLRVLDLRLLDLRCFDIYLFSLSVALGPAISATAIFQHRGFYQLSCGCNWL